MSVVEQLINPLFYRDSELYLSSRSLPNKVQQKETPMPFSLQMTPLHGVAVPLPKKEQPESTSSPSLPQHPMPEPSPEKSPVVFKRGRGRPRKNPLPQHPVIGQ
jgi:hypothetical protein